MGLKLFNTRTRSVEAFRASDPDGKTVGMYCCGPTVHDFAHIGNFRTFVLADLLRRHLEGSGYAVRHVMNITDVEDKIIARVREADVPLVEYTRRYEEAFLEDLRQLNCLPAHDLPRATENIPPIVALIERLVDRGFAYQAPDGSVYFSIEKYQAAGHRYGQLLNLNFSEMRPGQRVSSDEYEKESVADFALWKARTDADGPVFWKSPWGEGRPGWHVECSAMSMHLLGASFDIHLGGEDLVFPHHEDEIAQSEGSGLQENGAPFVQFWVHGAHLLVEGRKMAKSLGNFFTLRDLLEKGFSGREIRYLLLTAHYRESFNFTLEGLLGARSALGRIDECLGKLREIAANGSGGEPSESANVTGSGAEPDYNLVEPVTGALDDDLNVSAAWGSVFDWVREANRAIADNAITSAHAAGALAAWERLNRVFGLEFGRQEDAPPEAVERMEAREAARKARDFKKADAFRDDLKQMGWTVEDTPRGPRLKRL